MKPANIHQNPHLLSVAFGRVLIAMLIMMVALPAYAQDDNQSATSLQGKLFTTDYERNYLDALRRSFIADRRADSFNIDNLPPPLVQTEDEDTSGANVVLYSFNGAITLPGNRISVWLNGNLIPRTELPSGMTVRESDSGFSLLVRRNGGSWTLKPGQTINIDSGVIRDTMRIQ